MTPSIEQNGLGQWSLALRGAVDANGNCHAADHRELLRYHILW